MFRVTLIESPDILEELPVSLVGVALDQPVDGGVKETLVLIIGEVGMAGVDHAIIELEHVLDQQEKVVFVCWIDGVAHSS